MKLNVYQNLIWTTLYTVLDKMLLKTTDLTKNNTHKISFQISNLQCNLHKVIGLWPNSISRLDLKASISVSIFSKLYGKFNFIIFSVLFLKALIALLQKESD